MILCKRCHKAWEGHDVRPRLADADHEATIPGIVGELIADTLWREVLPGALPEIMARHIAGDPAVCSRCFRSLSGRPNITIFRRIEETIRAVAFHERSLPSSTPTAYRTRRAENYCAECERESDAEPTFLDTGPLRLRHKRASHLDWLLPRAGLECDDLSGIQGDRYGYFIRTTDVSAASTIALAVAEDLGYPTDHVSGIDPNLAVTDRDCETSDSNPGIDYPGL